MNVKKLEEVCDFISGLWTGKKPPYVSVGVIRNTNFQKNGILDFSDIAQLDVEVKQFSTRQLKFGDIVLEKSGGGPKQPVGRVCVFEKEDGLYSLSNFTSAIRIKNPKELDYRYLHYYLKHLYIAGETEKIQTHSTGIRNLQLSLYKEFLVPLPPLSTQQKIVAKLDLIFAEIDKATAAAEANAKNGEALFQSTLSKVFKGNNDWKTSTIGDALSLIKNGINCEQNKVPIGNKITRIETIAKKRFDFERVGYAALSEVEKDRSRLLVGDILFSHINSPIHVGKTAIYEAEEEIFHGINLLLMRTNNDVNPYFFNHFLNYLFATGYWEKNCKKSVNQASVNQKDISKVSFSYPELAFQQKIVERLDALVVEVANANTSYKDKGIQLAKLKNSILKQAFSGELVKE